MGKPRAPRPVKLLVGLLSGDLDLLRRARQLATRRWGATDLESEVWPFDQTDYYAAEMGARLAAHGEACAAVAKRLRNPGRRTLAELMKR